VEQATAVQPATSTMGVAPRRRLADRDGLLAWLFLLPAVIYVVALVAVPFVLALGFAFSDVSAGDSSFDWVGWDAFRRAFDDPIFWRALRNTVVITVISMVLIVVLGKILANILVADFRGKWVVRFLVLLPWTTPVRAVNRFLALAAGLDLQPDRLDASAARAHQRDMYWLGRPGLATASVIAVHVWRLVPLATVIILAGLVAIPKDVEEAARVDGAGFWRRMFEVTIPLPLPLIAVATLFGAIFTFMDMAVVYVLTRGGPTNSTQVLARWAFVRGIEGGDIAQGAAIAIFLFPLLLAAAVLILRAVRRMQVT
jgi:ABC-type sugar transport system permease subunit